MSGYIGTQPVPQATQTRDSFTATSGQTSFATSGYTPNFLDVFLNGVKLAAADYTATNGSDVVLASGAATGDILEVVAYTAFDTANVTGATNFTVTGAFTSQGIDDNANATAITIDSSERVMIGKTDTTFSTAGNVFYGDGSSDHTRNGLLLQLNRTTTDGEHIRLLKDGTTVGSIGVVSAAGDLYISSSDTDHAGLRFSSGCILPYRNGTLSDGTVDLGQTSDNYRFKDLYLSGGVYLGGTGAANKLEDYEEGTWTPSPTVGSASSASGQYTKVGNLVTVTGLVSGMNSSNNETLIIGGLPFTGGNIVTCVGQAMWSNVDKDFGYEQVFYNGSSQFIFYHSTTGSYDAIRHIDLDGSNSACYFSATYRV